MHRHTASKHNIYSYFTERVIVLKDGLLGDQNRSDLNTVIECNLDSKIDLQLLFLLYADLYCIINFIHLATIENSH